MCAMAEEQTPDFAELLRRARRAAGLSQEELAERAGLSARGISDLERGVNRAPRRDTLGCWPTRWSCRPTSAALTPAPPAAPRPDRRPRRPSGPPSTCRRRPTPFFGREAEVARLVALLRGMTCAW